MHIDIAQVISWVFNFILASSSALFLGVIKYLLKEKEAKFNDMISKIDTIILKLVTLPTIEKNVEDHGRMITELQKDVAILKAVNEKPKN